MEGDEEHRQCRNEWFRMISFATEKQKPSNVRDGFTVKTRLNTYIFTPHYSLHMTIAFSSANIVSLFEKYKVPFAADYVSIDIDSTDLWIFRAILASGSYLTHTMPEWFQFHATDAIYVIFILNAFTKRLF